MVRARRAAGKASRSPACVWDGWQMPRGWRRGACWLVVVEATTIGALLGRDPLTERVALVALTESSRVAPDPRELVRKLRFREGVGELLAVLDVRHVTAPLAVPGARATRVVADLRRTEAALPRKSR